MSGRLLSRTLAAAPLRRAGPSSAVRAAAAAPRSLSSLALRRPTASAARAPLPAAAALLAPAPAGAARHLSLWGSRSSEPPAPLSQQQPAASTSAAAAPPAPDAAAPASSASALDSLDASAAGTPLDAAPPHVESESSFVDAVAAVAPESAQQLSDALSATAVDLASLQANHWWLVSTAQGLLDTVHHYSGLPWWATIAAVTVTLRLSLLPLVIKGQVNAIRLNNINPEVKMCLEDLKAAKSSNDSQLMATSSQRVQQLFRENNCHPLKGFITPLVQMPLFITFFFALKGLGEGKLTSLTTGGLSWFTDLTATDPYYALPVLSAAATLLVVETGAEGGTGAVDPNTTNTVKVVMRVLTIGMIPFIAYLPTACFVYWTTNNLFSLLQLQILKSQYVRNQFNFPERINHNAGKPPVPAKGVIQTFRENLAKAQEDAARRTAAAPGSLRRAPIQTEEARSAALEKLVAGQRASEEVAAARQGESADERAARRITERNNKVRASRLRKQGGSDKRP